MSSFPVFTTRHNKSMDDRIYVEGKFEIPPVSYEVFKANPEQFLDFGLDPGCRPSMDDNINLHHLAISYKENAPVPSLDRGAIVNCLGPCVDCRHPEFVTTIHYLSYLANKPNGTNIARTHLQDVLGIDTDLTFSRDAKGYAIGGGITMQLDWCAKKGDPALDPRTLVMNESGDFGFFEPTREGTIPSTPKSFLFQEDQWLADLRQDVKTRFKRLSQSEQKTILDHHLKHMDAREGFIRNQVDSLIAIRWLSILTERGFHPDTLTKYTEQDPVFFGEDAIWSVPVRDDKADPRVRSILGGGSWTELLSAWGSRWAIGPGNDV